MRNHNSAPNLVNTRVVLLLGRWILLSGPVCFITLSMTALCFSVPVKRKIETHRKQLNTHTRDYLQSPKHLAGSKEDEDKISVGKAQGKL